MSETGNGLPHLRVTDAIIVIRGGEDRLEAIQAYAASNEAPAGGFARTIADQLNKQLFPPPAPSFARVDSGAEEANVVEEVVQTGYVETSDYVADEVVEHGLPEEGEEAQAADSVFLAHDELNRVEA